MLHKLLAGIDKERFDNTVISLTNRGEFASKIEALGVPVHTCGMKPGRFSLRGFITLMRLLVRLKPDVVQTWLYHADLLGGIAAKLAGIRLVVWNIRNSNFDSDKNKRHTLWTVRVNALLSSLLPSWIVCNSANAAQIHIDVGFKADRFLIIPNGFDIERFQPSEDAYASVRQELRIAPDTDLVGLIARFDPQKNHKGFIDAAALAVQQRRDIHFLLVGGGVDETNTALMRWIDDVNLRQQVHLLGRREDIPRLTAALNVAVCSSWGEGFPNVVGEAMSCEVPCVVTDVGDCAEIVGDSGRVATVGDMEGLAQQIVALLQLPTDERLSLGKQARERVQTRYGIGPVVKRYEDLYMELYRE